MVVHYNALRSRSDDPWSKPEQSTIEAGLGIFAQDFLLAAWHTANRCPFHAVRAEELK